MSNFSEIQVIVEPLLPDGTALSIGPSGEVSVFQNGEWRRWPEADGLLLAGVPSGWYVSIDMIDEIDRILFNRGGAG